MTTAQRGPATVPPIVRDVLRSPGRPLDPVTRAFMEPKLGHDFRRVRVHADSQAAASAQSVNALAYTVGRDVVFGAARYAPGTPAGRHLLAHELAHVVQQRDASGVLFSPLPMTAPGDASEREASGVAARLVRGEMATPTLRQAPAIARQGPATTDAPVSNTRADSDQFSEEELAEAGLIAVGTVLQTSAAPEAEALRAIYNEGAARIAAERTRMLAEGIPEEQIARRLSQMRHELAVNVRQSGSALLRRGAEAFDRVRGNVGRPTYESLRRTRTDAQIIRSASQTNRFINRLPSGLRWTGRSLWVVSAGISVYVVVSASEAERAAVMQEEAERVIGGVGGAAIGQGLCIAFAVATEGLGLIVCGLLGGIAGSELATRGNLLQVLDIAPHPASGEAGKLYRIQGDWDVTDLFIVGFVHRRVAASERVLVVATGMRSGSLVSGRYGHYRSLEVVPANNAAVTLFEGTHARYVPEYLLGTPDPSDLHGE